MFEAIKCSRCGNEIPFGQTLVFVQIATVHKVEKVTLCELCTREFYDAFLGRGDCV